MFFKRPARRIKIYPLGHTYNLLEIFDSINEEYFEEKLSLPISWFGNPLREAKTRRTLGSFHFETGLIRIHRLLDHPHFPPYFISYVVYHEMLHSLVPPLKRRHKGRRIHHQKFVAMEKAFKEYHLAKEWEKKYRKFGLSYGRPQ